jgi:hypothetical protein
VQQIQHERTDPRAVLHRSADPLGKRPACLRAARRTTAGMRTVLGDDQWSWLRQIEHLPGDMTGRHHGGQRLAAPRTGRRIMVDGGIGLFDLAKCLAGMPLLTAGLLPGRFAQAADSRWLLQPVAGRWFAAVAAVQPKTALQFSDACQKRLSLADKKLDMRQQGGNGRLVATYGRCWVWDRARRLGRCHRRL